MFSSFSSRQIPGVFGDIMNIQIAFKRVGRLLLFTSAILAVRCVFYQSTYRCARLELATFLGVTSFFLGHTPPLEDFDGALSEVLGGFWPFKPLQFLGPFELGKSGFGFLQHF